MVTDDPEFARRVTLMRSHGIEHEEERFAEGGEAPDPWHYEQQILGYNYRMTDFQAALLRSQLGKLKRFSARRKEIAARYDAAFAGNDAILTQKRHPKSDACRHLYVIRLAPGKLSCTRREFFEAMDEEGIRCQVHYILTHTSPFYRSLGYEKGICPVAEEVYEGIMSIPLYPAMTDKDVDRVIDTVNGLCGRFS